MQAWRRTVSPSRSRVGWIELGPAAAVFSPDSGVACGIEPAIDDRAGILLAGDEAAYESGLCSTLDAALARRELVLLPVGAPRVSMASAERQAVGPGGMEPQPVAMGIGGGHLLLAGSIAWARRRAHLQYS